MPRKTREEFSYTELKSIFDFLFGLLLAGTLRPGRVSFIEFVAQSGSPRLPRVIEAKIQAKTNQWLEEGGFGGYSRADTLRILVGCGIAVHPKFVFRVDPAATQCAAAGDMFEISLHNDGGRMIMYKMKTTDRNTYRMSPIYGIVRPFEMTKVTVEKQAGGVGQEKVVVETMLQPGNMTDVVLAFNSHGADHSTTVRVSAV